MSWRVVIGVSTAAVLLFAGYLAFRDGGDATYTPEEVIAALSRTGITVREVRPPEGVLGATDGTYLTPNGDAFTMLVYRSDALAAKVFRQYEGDTDPATFELLDRNVVVIADFSNGDEPLNEATRTRIMTALDALRRERG